MFYWFEASITYSDYSFVILDDAIAPDLHSAALAAYGAAAYASGGFGGSTGASGTTGSAAAPNYASYYNNYMAFYPPTANPSSGYAGYGSGAAGTGPQLPTHPSATGNQAIYHLNNALPPPSIAEPGINSLDDIVNNKPGKNLNVHNYSKWCIKIND